MIKVSMLILSLLSDAQESLFGNGEKPSYANVKINFAKYLTLKYTDNSVEINSDEAFTEFKTKHPKLVDC